MLVLGQHRHRQGHHVGDVDLSPYLSDVILLFRYFEAQGNVYQGGFGGQEPHPGTRGQHPRVPAGTVRAFIVGDPLVDFEGILTGSPLLSAE